MPEPRTLFLIDGSNQMYRAYHAIRGLTGPDGRSTNAVYGFVTMLRKLLADHHPAFIAASFDLAGGDVSRPDRRRLQGQPRADAARPRRSDPVGARGLRGDGRADPDQRRLRSRRRDRDAGPAGRRAGFEVAIVTGDKDFFQLVDGPIRVYNPKEEGAWFDAGGVLDKFGVRPDQVVDVLALMGDTIDNVKGVPGHRREGRARPDRDVRIARCPARSRPPR